MLRKLKSTEGNFKNFNIFLENFQLTGPTPEQKKVIEEIEVTEVTEATEATGEVTEMTEVTEIETDQETFLAMIEEAMMFLALVTHALSEILASRLVRELFENFSATAEKSTVSELLSPKMER
jgi:hypothetical protein